MNYRQNAHQYLRVFSITFCHQNISASIATTFIVKKFGEYKGTMCLVVPLC